MYIPRSPQKRHSGKLKLRALPMTLCGMVSATGKKTRESKSTWGYQSIVGNILLQASCRGSEWPHAHRLPASSLVPLPYCKPILRCVWIGARAFNASQNCALSALKISFTFFVVAGNITGRFRTQANGEHMVVGQACQQSFSRRVEHSGAAGVTSG